MYHTGLYCIVLYYVVYFKMSKYYFSFKLNYFLILEFEIC